MSRTPCNHTLVAVLLLATSNALGATPGRGAAMPAELYARARGGAATADDAAAAARTMTLPACAASASALCLDSRFLVTAAWGTASGSGSGQAVPLTADTGYFWFFDPNNVEVVVKVLDACALSPKRFWVFAGGLTNTKVTLTVKDTHTGTTKTYTNALGTNFQPIQDANAFATCGGAANGAAAVAQAPPAPRDLARAWSEFAGQTGAVISVPAILGSFGSDRTSPGRLNHPDGVAIDGAGNVFVTDALNFRVQKFSPGGQFLAQWGTQGNGNGQFAFLQAIAISMDGHVFVLDSSRLQRFTADGQYVSEIGAGQLTQPQAIALDPAGDVYVAAAGTVLRYTAQGQLRNQFGSFGGGPGQFKVVSSLTVAMNGDLLVADPLSHRIERFSSSGQYLGLFGTSGTGPDQVYYPSGLAADTAGNVYVTDGGLNRVQKFSSGGAFLTGWGGPGTGNGQFTNPGGIAVSPAGGVYVADAGNQRIEQFSTAGQYLGQWGWQGGGPGELNGPQGVAVDSSGAVYVADTYFNRVQKFTASGRFLAQFGSLGAGNGQLNAPADVAIDPSGNVYVVDSNNQRIAKFGPGGNWLGSFSTAQLGLPSAIAIDSGGNVYLTDVTNVRIVKVDGNGQLLGSWGSSGSAPGQFSYPASLALDTGGNVYVADTYNDRVEAFSPYGQFRGQFPVPGTFPYPQAVTVDPNDNVIVGSTNGGQITALDPLGTLLAQWGSTGIGLGQFRYIQGIAADAVGRVFVGDSFNHRITAFSFACTPTPTSLCLNGGRFRVTIRWQSSAAAAGAGKAVQLTADTGYFWFFNQNNVEVIVKVLNGCGLGNRYWLFAAGLTNVAADLIVEDTRTGVSKAYTTNQGPPVPPILDTGALAACP
jgi:tripartite motif-containing protein 71